MEGSRDAKKGRGLGNTEGEQGSGAEGSGTEDELTTRPTQNCPLSSQTCRAGGGHTWPSLTVPTQTFLHYFTLAPSSFCFLLSCSLTHNWAEQNVKRPICFSCKSTSLGLRWAWEAVTYTISTETRKASWGQSRRHATHGDGAPCFTDHGGYFYPHEGPRQVVFQEDESLEMMEKV